MNFGGCELRYFKKDFFLLALVRTVYLKNIIKSKIVAVFFSLSIVIVKEA
ncbi:hypothetical protein SAMN05192550_1776 [Flavobacterium glycines]|uniref:Uncharacterized protein n=1 Tax=Flavobacterium glycines TaxID=551990 RepID=A0A511CEP2_9FLAO|nr:hypothetical protein FGL01_18800 [Flavobacterium glycines]SDJ27139.1 hypothetical protein SAMN05192550_1776 [Flavobacterium glycines]